MKRIFEIMRDDFEKILFSYDLFYVFTYEAPQKCQGKFFKKRRSFR